jgi:hypothetical protein
MKFNLIIIIIIIILILLLIKYNDKYETYDGVIHNITSIEDCADITSSIYETSALAYDPSNNNCYPSKTSLTKPPIQIHPYHNDFKITDIICNKTLYAKNPELDFDEILIGNRLYECYNNESKIKDDIDLYYFEKDKPKKLITYQDISKLPITRHNFFNIDWPLNKDEMNDINVKMQKIKSESESIVKTKIDSIDWVPKIKRIDKEIKLDYGSEYKYPKLGCISS